MGCLTQTVTPNSYSRQEELIFRDCDAAGRLRPGTLLSLLASTAGHDYEARGLGYRRLYEIRQVFLLSRVSLRIHRCPLSGEVVTVTTWENGFRLSHVRRNYELTDESGALCVSAKSDWVIVDPEGRKLIRPADFTGKELTVCPKEIDAPECRKVVLPSGMTELGAHVVVYSDLDYNGHVYSGNYGDILWDVLPAELQNAALREMQLNYSREATLGDTMRLAGVREGNVLTAGALVDGEHCFSCRCVFA